MLFVKKGLRSNELRTYGADPADGVVVLIRHALLAENDGRWSGSENFRAASSNSGGEWTRFRCGWFLVSFGSLAQKEQSAGALQRAGDSNLIKGDRVSYKG